MMVIAAVRNVGMLEFRMMTNTPFDPEESSEIVPTVRGVTTWYNDELAQMIREHPSQYWWLHRRWKGKPRGYRKRMRKAG
jgi:KDO2-lipid IV(A) lauroyltransferase